MAKCTSKMRNIIFKSIRNIMESTEVKIGNIRPCKLITRNTKKKTFWYMKDGSSINLCPSIQFLWTWIYIWISYMGNRPERRHAYLLLANTIYIWIIPSNICQNSDRKFLMYWNFHLSFKFMLSMFSVSTIKLNKAIC